MEQNNTEQTQQPKPKGRGGVRPNAGRKKGSKNHVSVEDLLASLESRCGGQTYEDLLVEDFMSARSEGDKNIILKYHNLILNKVMNTLAKIEVTDSADAVEIKKLAFAEALSKLTGVGQGIDSEDSEEHTH
jgi:hypothetical protein